MRSRQGFRRLVETGVFVYAVSSRFLSGQTTGSIVGRVVDVAGAAMPSVTVEVTSENLQGARITVTDTRGRYRFPAVPPGSYGVKAALPGFRPVETTTVVWIDATATVDLTLTLSAEARVEVSGRAPVVDATSTTTGTTYSGRLYMSLPVGRNYASIVQLNPGVSSDLGSTHGRVLPLTIDGSTSAENLWLIEGINTTDVVYGTQGKLLSEEFVQELQVKTGGYQAEYGGALGGVINVATKSGGNAFHGAAFVYYDSGSTRADPLPFTPGVDFSRNDILVTPGNNFDFGVDLGGFLVKDRVWFYGLYNRVDTPSTISDRQDPSNPAAFPLATVTSMYGGKLSVNVSSSTTFVGTVFSDPTSASGAACGDPISSSDPGTWQCNRTYGGLDGALRLDQLLGTHVFMSLQASEHRDSYGLEATGAGAAVQNSDGRCEGGTPDIPCTRDDPPQVSGGLGFVNGTTDNARSKRVQYGGSATFYVGNHEVKAGGEYQTVEQTALNYYTGGQTVSLLNEYGQEYYRHDFFSRSPTELTPVAAPQAPRGQQLSFYGQDAFRVTPNLTINAGVRFDQQTFKNMVGTTVLETSNEWQPRVGVVWDPWNDGRTRAYASVGRFYDALPLDFAKSFGIPTYNVSTFNFDPLGTAQALGVVKHPDPLITGNDYATPVDAGLKGIYQDELTVGFERALTPTLAVGLKGTYRSLGRTIEDRCDLNPTLNDYNSCAIANPGSSGRYARGDVPTCNGLDDPYNACSETGAAMPAAKRIYRGIEILARQTIGDRLFVQASYTYSSLRGNYEGLVSEFGQTDPGILADFDYPEFSKNNYGDLTGDHPQSARLDLSYTFPFKAFVGLGAYVQSGSPTNRIGFAHVNLPFTVPVYLVMRGSQGRLPTLWAANLTAGYPFAIGPVTVTAQLYLFNLFNSQIVTYRWTIYRNANPPGYPDTIYDPVAPPDYQGHNWQAVVSRQDPRLFRAALRISF
ncbi:MAG TPA: TonB-dependent receptor [Thermoanaerobaculia bacterium]|nr:TonB-dependent receptor [Thermoanaerobaculia bacterium]